MNWQNRLTSILKINFPFVQAPMLGITTPAMVAAISNTGGLGSLAIGGLSPEDARKQIRAVKELTNKPFSVNFFAHTIPAEDQSKAYQEMVSFTAELCALNNIPFTPPTFDSLKFHTWKDQLEVMLQENIPVASFTFGVPDQAGIEQFKSKGMVLIGTATCIEEALLLENSGIDVISVQGSEAGGHRGSFLTSDQPPLIGSMSLIPQVADAVYTPLLAAGGIAEGRSMASAFVLGAEGVQVGSAFLACHESAAGDKHKYRIQNGSAIHSVLTRAFTGRWARGLENNFIRKIEASGRTIPAYPYQNSLTTPIRSYAQQQQLTDFIAIWAGQSASKAVRKPAAEIMQTLIQQAEMVFKSFVQKKNV